MNENLNNDSESIESDGTFWDLYINEHQNPLNRWMHAIGTLLASCILIYSMISQNWWLIILAPLVGYGMAWMGHFFVEKNKPLSFKFPIKSFFSDFRLAFLMLTGQSPKK